MIKLTLLHPLQSIPVRSWSFEDDQVVRIGRSTDNHVVLYSAVVSRRHVELRHNGANWEAVNLGTNGTYLDGQPITQASIIDGAIIHLARSGPKIQIHIEKNEPKPQLGRISLKPREKAVGTSPESGLQTSTVTEPNPPGVGVPPSKEEEEQTEVDGKRGYCHEK